MAFYKKDCLKMKGIYFVKIHNIKHRMTCFIRSLGEKIKPGCKFYNYFSIAPRSVDLRAALKAEGISGGISFLNTQYRFFKPAYSRFLLALYSHLSKTSTLSENPDKNKKDFLIHFSCWGESYANKALNYLLPSMLAEGNLPALAQKYNIIVFIHCDTHLAAALKTAKISEEIKKYAALCVSPLPARIIKLYKAATNYPKILAFHELSISNDMLKYFFLGACQSHALQIGLKRKAIISFLMPDIVLSDAFFSCGAAHIEGKKLILASSFRTDFFKAQPELNKFRCKKSSLVLTIPAGLLAKIQVKYLHEYDARRVISEKTEHFIPCPRFIFKTSRGLVLRALHYHPILMNCSEISHEIKADYLPIDDSVLKQILSATIPFEQQVWFAKDTTLMNFAELSGTEPMLSEPPTFKGVYFTYDALVETLRSMVSSSAIDFNRQINRFFIQNRIEYDFQDDTHSQDDTVNDATFVSDLCYRLDQDIELIQ